MFGAADATLLIYSTNISVNRTNIYIIFSLSAGFRNFFSPQYLVIVLRSQPWLGLPSRDICGTNDHGYIPLVVNTSRSFPHSRLITDKFHFDELIIIPPLYYTNTLSWLFIVIAHCNISPCVAMWLLLDVLFWFKDNKFFASTPKWCVLSGGIATTFFFILLVWPNLGLNHNS